MNTWTKSGLVAFAKAQLVRMGWQNFVLAALILGVVLRLIHYGLGRMLWLDESMLVINLIDRSGADLLEPLDFNQIAPVGWVWLTDVFVDTFKNLAYSARFPTLIAGLTSLWLFYRLCRALFSGPTSFVAVTAFAVSFMPVFYSAEVKPYQFDILLWVILGWMTLKWIEEDRLSILALVGLAAVFVLGSTIALAAPIVVGTFGVVFVLNRYLKRDWRAVFGISAAAALSASLYLLLAVTVYNAQVETIGLNEGVTGIYFDRHYAPFPPTSLRELMWYPNVAEAKLNDLFGERSGYVIGFLTICGGIVAIKKNIWLISICVGPVILAALFSTLHIYPVVTRLMLYLVPIFILLSALAVEHVIESSDRLKVPVVIGAIVFMNVGTLSQFSQEHTFSPEKSARDISAELTTISEKKAEGDVILVTNWSLPTYLLYRDKFGLANQRWAIVQRAPCLTESSIYHLQSERVWLINPFSAWASMDRRLQIGPNNRTDRSVVYTTEPLIEAMRWMRKNDLEISPAIPFDCDAQRELSGYLNGGVTAIQWD